MSLEARAKALALEAGFDLCGLASLDAPPPTLPHLAPWLAAGYAGEMAWISRQLPKRLDPSLILPGAKSMLCLGLVYNTDKPYSAEVPGQPWVSRYAWGEDYHAVMERKLAALEARLHAELGPDFASRRYCDTGPISEKAWAAAAGLGWVGKHSNLIHREKGSWFFLGEILLTLELTPDQPASDLCGTCTRCLDACPTAAFPKPYQLDATRCISYLTIEQRGPIPEEFHGAMGMNLYGCDICQDVCPWNRAKITGQEPAFQPRPGMWNPDPARLPEMDLKGSAMKRAKPEGLKRNAEIVLKNQKA